MGAWAELGLRRPCSDVCGDAAGNEQLPERPAKLPRTKDPRANGEDKLAGLEDIFLGVLQRFRGQVLTARLETELLPELVAALSVIPEAGQANLEATKCELKAAQVAPKPVETEDGRLRLTRQALEERVCKMRSIDAEVVKYKDKATGKMLEARVPATVLALLRLRATCSGKPISEQRLARMALDAMEEQAFDPVRALASLSPASLLCPAGPLSVLGSGEIGVVFLEEESGEVVKVMLEDFAKKEYDVFCAFAKAGLTPFPLAFQGPCIVPDGELYSIRMKRIEYTLHDVLWATAPCGPRRGLAPPSAARARDIGAAIVQAMQRMWDEGLVHGDLHLRNLGFKEEGSLPVVQLLDFGRSASRSLAPPQSRTSTQACRAGHEYDVCRFVVELCLSFENLVFERDELAQECRRELRELRRAERDPGDDTELLHRARLVAGFEAFLADEPRALAQAEAAYNTILDAIIKYATVKHDISVDGVPSIRERSVRQLCKRRMDACDKLYFKSALFWQED